MDKLVIGNGKALHIAHIGSSHLPSSTKNLALTNVLHVPAITKPLLSIRKLCTDNDYFMEFYSDHYLVKEQTTKTPILHRAFDFGLYKLQNYSNCQPHSTTTAFLASLEEWTF